MSEARLQIEAEMIACEVQDVKLATALAFATDPRNYLEESDFTDRKTFLRAFIKKISVEGEQVTVTYKLSQKTIGRVQKIDEVLPIDTFGGPFGTVPELLFEKKGLIPALQQLIISL